MELKSRDDIIKIIISNMYYGIEGHPRYFLAKIMVSGYKEMRLFATQFLGEIFDSYRSQQLGDWGIRVLIPQVYIT